MSAPRRASMLLAFPGLLAACHAAPAPPDAAEQARISRAMVKVEARQAQLDTHAVTERARADAAAQSAWSAEQNAGQGNESH